MPEDLAQSPERLTRQAPAPWSSIVDIAPLTNDSSEAQTSQLSLSPEDFYSVYAYAPSAAAQFRFGPANRHEYLFLDAFASSRREVTPRVYDVRVLMGLTADAADFALRPDDYSQHIDRFVWARPKSQVETLVFVHSPIAAAPEDRLAQARATLAKARTTLGANVTQVAGLVGVARKTIYEWHADDSPSALSAESFQSIRRIEQLVQRVRACVGETVAASYADQTRSFGGLLMRELLQESPVNFDAVEQWAIAFGRWRQANPVTPTADQRLRAKATPLPGGDAGAPLL